MKYPDTQFGFHKASNTLMSIEDALTGLSCDCVCLECGGRLIAVKNFKNTDRKIFFQHHNPNNETPCEFSGSSRETALHYALKMQIAIEKQIQAPPVIIPRRCPYLGYTYTDFVVYKGLRPLIFDEVLIEKRLDSIIPDCTGIIGEHRYAIEIKVTHGVDDDKFAKINALRVNCIELHAPTEQVDFDPSAIINDARYSKWLRSNKALKAETLQSCEDWYVRQEEWIKNDIEQKHQALLAADLKARPKRIQAVYTTLMSQWDRDHLGFTYPDLSFYENVNTNLNDLCSRIPELAHLYFPYQMKNDLYRMREHQHRIRPIYRDDKGDLATLRKNLIEALDYQRTHCGVESADRGAVVVDRLSNCSSDEVRFGLDAYLSDMRTEVIEKYVDRATKRWIKNKETRGEIFENPAYEYAQSMAFERMKNRLVGELKILGFSMGMAKGFNKLFTEYMAKKQQVEQPEPVQDTGEYDALSREIESKQKALNSEVITYVRSLTGPHTFARGELIKYAEELLSSTGRSLDCAKELIGIRMSADFQARVRPHNERMRPAVMQETMSRVQAMNDEVLKRTLA
ncbi:MAG: hypothetical protein ACI9OH_000494 [Oleispira sp.]|jgi:hypothetical protein